MGWDEVAIAFLPNGSIDTANTPKTDLDKANLLMSPA